MTSILAVGAVIGLGLAQSSAPARERPLIQFVVSIPQTDQPAPDEIYCSMSIDDWPAGGRALPRVGPGLYAAEWHLAPGGAPIEYKFSREKTWSTVEKGTAGQELGNRELKVAGDAQRQVVFHSVARWADQVPAQPQRAAFSVPPGGDRPAAPTSVLTGDIRTHAGFESPQFGNARTILVYLPPGYADRPNERYPVLYMHDGQNIFYGKTSFAGVEWGVDETAQRLIEAGRLPPVIVVGIYNNAQRFAEYTPWPDALRGGGDGDKYLAFIADTLKPFIDQTYRTRPEREHTAIAGSSLGGLISLYAACKRPDVFGRAGVVSPALRWADGRVLEFVREHPPKPPVRMWIDMGTAEGAPSGPLAAFSRAVADCRDLVGILRDAGLKPGRDYQYDEIDGGKHNEAAWAQRIDRILLYLFPVEASADCAQSAPAASR